MTMTTKADFRWSSTETVVLYIWQLSLEYSLSIVCWSFDFGYCRVGLICACFFGVKATKFTRCWTSQSHRDTTFIFLLPFFPFNQCLTSLAWKRVDDDDEDDCCCCRTCLLLFRFIFGNSLPACSAVLADATELRLAKTSYLWEEREIILEGTLSCSFLWKVLLNRR